MTNELLKNQFADVCKRLIDAYDPLLSEAELEPSYDLLLEFLVQNEQYREDLIHALYAIIRSYRNSHETKEKLFPGSAIAYCMHVLRWQEIYDFALAENRVYYSKKMGTGVTGILDAYNDDWDDKEFYRRFNGKHVKRPVPAQ